MEAASTQCESCGRDEVAAELLAVRRVYVTPATPGFEDITEESIRVEVDLELWCFSCRSSYPHQVDGADELEL